MVCSAIRQRVPHRDVTVGADLDFRGEESLSAANRLRGHFLEIDLAVVVAHMAGMVLRHADAESSLEASRRAARHCVPLVPSECFGSLFQHFHRSEGIVRIPRVAVVMVSGLMSSCASSWSLGIIILTGLPVTFARCAITG